MDKKRIVARVKILDEYFEPKFNKNIELKEFYKDWYPFNGQELDVFLYSESFIDRERKQKVQTYGYEFSNGTFSQVKLIPAKHCELIYKFL
jgi:hypothetical protein